jgi:hypothetical protein
MNMDLYSLPKDMLIKLVSTIREDTIKEYTEKMEDLQIRFNLMKEVSVNSQYPIWVDKCSFLDCKGIYASDGRDYDASHNCEEIFYCKNCDELFCDQHIKNFLCAKCSKEL